MAMAYFIAGRYSEAINSGLARVFIGKQSCAWWPRRSCRHLAQLDLLEEARDAVSFYLENFLMKLFRNQKVFLLNRIEEAYRFEEDCERLAYRITENNKIY